MSFLDIEHYLGLRGSDTFSKDGNEGTIVSKYLIGEILAERVNAYNVVPNLYREFAKRLQPCDMVITFNYDTLLERALEEVGTPYRLFPLRYSTISENFGTIDCSREEVVVLKPHGSIDWFDRSSFEHQMSESQKNKAPPAHDVIFSDGTALGLVPLIDGAHHREDPLRSVYRAKNLRALYKRDLLFKATPRILSPSANKLLYFSGMNKFWHGMNDAGLLNFSMAIIGFSLPAQDEYARQILYKMVKNYQTFDWGRVTRGHKKTPLAIIDYFRDDKSEMEFRKRYRFVDWSRAVLIGSGFDQTSLDQIFP